MLQRHRRYSGYIQALVGHLGFHHVRPNHSLKRTASPPLNSNVRRQMTSESRRVPIFFVSGIIFVLLTVILVLLDTKPPNDTYSIEGVVSSMVPIETKGKLTGFRFCIGNPVMTFTYLDPDPNIVGAWAKMQKAKTARVIYSIHPSRNPTLWSLEANGQSIATAGQLQEARSSRFWLLLVGACASGIAALSASASWLNTRRGIC